MAVTFSGEKLKELRTEQNISQYQLGNASNIDPRYIRFLESGERRNPSAIVLYSVSKALGASMEELMETEESPE